MNSFKKITATVGAAALALTLTACSDSSGGGGETITIGYLPSWTDTLSTAYLLDDQLTEMGYEVEHETFTDVAILYTGVANGDVDVYASAWPEVTHAPYMEEYGEDIEDLGTYSAGGGGNHLSVPEYMEDVNSITDLIGQGERFDGTIYGIEPGAGLTEATGAVMEGYGLDSEYELETSSTPAMLSELQSAVDEERDIVVTLWTPFWANGQFPVKTLEDPEGHFGEPESMHFLAHEGFSEQFPEVAEWIGEITLDDDQYNDLENTVVNEFGEGQEAEAVDDWISRNPDVLPEQPAEA